MEENKTKKALREVHEITCGKCGKTIISLSENQAEYNMKVHKINCKGKRK